MSYAPQPGTVAYRAMAWLEKQPRETELTASVWAEAIGSDALTLVPCLRPALHAGLVREHTKNGMARPKWYSLGDGKPLQVRKVAGEEDERDQLPQRTSAPDVKPKPGEVLPGIQVPRFRDTLAVHAALDAAAAREAEPQADAVADAQVVVSKPEEVVARDPHIARTIAEAEARFVPRQAKQQREAAPARETTRPETPRVAFDCWLSGVSGELVLQGLELDEDGDAVLTPERVMALRRLLLGIMT